MFDLTGKVALVAGGAGWLGASICRKLVEQGASVVVADIDEIRAPRVADAAAQEAAAARSGVQVRALRLDVDQEQSIREAVAATVADCGRLDVLVNATFAAVGRLVEEITAEEFDATLHTNVVGAFLLAREAAAAMREGGSIILFGSMYGLIAPDPRIYPAPLKPNPVEYGVAKAGIIQMARYLAVHWAPRRIRVNAIVPGSFPKAAVQEEHPDFIERLAAKAPLGRIGTPDEIAAAVVYLASQESAFVTGTSLVVDGGWTAW